MLIEGTKVRLGNNFGPFGGKKRNGAYRVMCHVSGRTGTAGQRPQQSPLRFSAASLMVCFAANFTGEGEINRQLVFLECEGLIMNLSVCSKAVFIM